MILIHWMRYFLFNRKQHNEWPLTHSYRSTIWSYVFLLSFLDSCLVNNGNCDVNADCSHDTATFGVVCTCKKGYSNTGTNGVVKCTGKWILLMIVKILPTRRLSFFSETCKVNNGGCDVNSICTFDANNGGVKCTCKVGYTDVDQSQVVICKGEQSHYIPCFLHWFLWISLNFRLS